jgi:hypothetical protein
MLSSRTLSEMRARFWIETFFAVVGAALLVLTLFSREWIEVAFGVDPDGGSGALELGIAVGLLALAAVSATLARKEWRPRESRFIGSAQQHAPDHLNPGLLPVSPGNFWCDAEGTGRAPVRAAVLELAPSRPRLRTSLVPNGAAPQDNLTDTFSGT